MLISALTHLRATSVPPPCRISETLKFSRVWAPDLRATSVPRPCGIFQGSATCYFHRFVRFSENSMKLVASEEKTTIFYVFCDFYMFYNDSKKNHQKTLKKKFFRQRWEKMGFNFRNLCAVGGGFQPRFP